MMDDLLGAASDPFDTSGLDYALQAYDTFQKVQLGVFGAGAGFNLLKAGKKLWGKYVTRSGGRQSLLGVLEGGMNRTRQFFRPRNSKAGWTVPNPGRGWRVGDPINNLTEQGTAPHWPAIRKRFWKNEAYYNPQAWDSTQVQRMQRGLAPQQFNELTGKWESMELHHDPAQRFGGMYEFYLVWPSQHAEIDDFRRLRR
jgi:hypothetical protein